MEKSLYERLGGVFAIAAVVDHFSDAIVKNPIVGPAVAEPCPARVAHRATWAGLPGLKFMRTLWVCNVAGGPFEYSGTHPGRRRIGLEEAHRRFRISPEEFDEVAAELGANPRRFGVPAAGEGRGPGSLCGPQGRGDRRGDRRHSRLNLRPRRESVGVVCRRVRAGHAVARVSLRRL